MLLHFIWNVQFYVLWLTSINFNIAVVTEKKLESDSEIFFYVNFSMTLPTFAKVINMFVN